MELLIFMSQLSLLELFLRDVWLRKRDASEKGEIMGF